MSYTSEDYSPDFISPFSNNMSTLKLSSIPDSSILTDVTTMWELELLKTLKESQDWLDLRSAPQIIGPDRGTVQHTVNVFSSFKEDVSYIRPDYKAYVDIIGTQSSLGDATAREENYKLLSGEGLEAAWCTMCGQEWSRVVDKTLGYGDSEGNRLRGARAPVGYWASYEEHWGMAQPPANQILLGQL